MFDLIFSDRSTDKLFIGRVDPRAKILLFICFINVVLIIPTVDLIALVVLGLALVLLIFFADIPISKIVKAILKIYPMIVIMSFFQIISINTGDYQYSGIGLLDISVDSWVYITGFQIKTLLILKASLLLITTTPIKLFLTGIAKLKAPGWIVAVTFFIYHFVFIVMHELTRLQIAFQSRYIKLPIIKRLFVQARLLAVFLTRIFERNDLLYNALISRGFNGVLPLHLHLSWKKSDTMLVLSGISFLFLIQWIM